MCVVCPCCVYRLKIGNPSLLSMKLESENHQNLFRAALILVLSSPAEVRLREKPICVFKHICSWRGAFSAWAQFHPFTHEPPKCNLWFAGWKTALRAAGWNHLLCRVGCGGMWWAPAGHPPKPGGSPLCPSFLMGEAQQSSKLDSSASSQLKSGKIRQQGVRKARNTRDHLLCWVAWTVVVKEELPRTAW